VSSHYEYINKLLYIFNQIKINKEKAEAGLRELFNSSSNWVYIQKQAKIGTLLWGKDYIKKDNGITKDIPYVITKGSNNLFVIIDNDYKPGIAEVEVVHHEDKYVIGQSFIVDLQYFCEADKRLIKKTLKPMESFHILKRVSKIVGST
jgi:hypothetical protein